MPFHHLFCVQPAAAPLIPAARRPNCRLLGCALGCRRWPSQAGYTAFSVGMRNNRLVYIPINAMVKSSPRQMDPHGQSWERVISVTRQPNTVPPKAKKG